MFNARERLTEFFDGWAESYETLATRSDYFPYAWIPRHTQDIAGLDQCEVLDLACGSGLNLKLLCAQRGGIRAEGLDISPKMLEQARSTERYHKLHTHDLANPFPEGPSANFDLVIAFSCLDYLTDVNACLSECHRVLKPNGTLWASFRRFEAEDEGSPPRHVSVEGINVTGYSAGEIIHIVQGAHMYLIGIEALTGYISRTGFPCPYYVVRARKSQ